MSRQWCDYEQVLIFVSLCNWTKTHAEGIQAVKKHVKSGQAKWFDKPCEWFGRKKFQILVKNWKWQNEIINQSLFKVNDKNCQSWVHVINIWNHLVRLKNAVSTKRTRQSTLTLKHKSSDKSAVIFD